MSFKNFYAEAVLKFEQLNTQSQQHGAVVQGRSLSPYRLRYTLHFRAISSVG
ncbi:MAG: hypothetical protein LBK06_07570 [Planctomycetaceae bacterium]|nr:hypothetical protein [Planctomycetaceae bacterium]